MKKALTTTILLFSIFQGSSFAEEWSVYKKVLTQKAINYCFVMEGVLTEKDANILNNHFLIERAGLTQSQVDIASRSIVERNDDFVKRNGGCKNILDGYGRINLINNGVIPK